MEKVIEAFQKAIVTYQATTIGVVSNLGVQPISMIYPETKTIQEGPFVVPPQAQETITEEAPPTATSTIETTNREGEDNPIIIVTKYPLPSDSEETHLPEEEKEEDEEFEEEDVEFEEGNLWREA